MGTNSTFVILAVLLTLYSVAQSDDAAQKKECLKFSKRSLKTMMKSFNQCNKKLKYHEVSPEEYQKKIGCVVKCVMQSVNALDVNDMMTEESLKKSIEANVPQEFTQDIHDRLVKCVKTQPLDPKDENCKSYLDMGTCMQGAVVDMCGEPPMM